MTKKKRLTVALLTVAMATAGTSLTAWAAGWQQDGDRWYYLDSKDNKISDKWLKIDGKEYYFDSDGSMKTGWHMEDDDIYYLGDRGDGSMKTGWVCLTYDEDNPPNEGDVSAYTTPGNGSAWFYFQGNGKAVRSEGSSAYSYKTINNVKYYFDENGAMQTGWIAVDDGDSNDSTGISKFKYFGADHDGSMAKGWRYLTEHPADSDDSDQISGDSSEKPGSGQGYWYYFDSDGTPKHLNSNAANMSNATVKISGESYFFDAYGCMRYGLLGINLKDGDTVSAYFGDSDGDGKMRTGKQTNVKEDNGNTATFYFSTSGSSKGAGYRGEKDNYLYYNGKVVKADSGADYEVFEVDGRHYLVNESGKVETSSKFYKSDGEYRYEISGGTIYEVNSDKERQGEADADGTLPTVEYLEIIDV